MPVQTHSLSNMLCHAYFRLSKNQPFYKHTFLKEIKGPHILLFLPFCKSQTKDILMTRKIYELEYMNMLGLSCAEPSESLDLSGLVYRI